MLKQRKVCVRQKQAHTDTHIAVELPPPEAQDPSRGVRQTSLS